MRNFLHFYHAFLKGSKPVKMVTTIHVSVHGGRSSYLFYDFLSLDLISIGIWGVLLVFYIVQIIWRSQYNIDNKVKKYYKVLEIGIHVMFHAFFLYVLYLHRHVEIFVTEIVLYWGVELMLKIVKMNKKKRDGKE